MSRPMLAHLTRLPPTASQVMIKVMTSISKDTIVEAKDFNLLAALDLGVLGALRCRRWGSTADGRPSPFVVGVFFTGV